MDGLSLANEQDENAGAGVGGEFRVFYLAKRADAIYVLHAFRKKSQQTRKVDIELARQRLRLIGE